MGINSLSDLMKQVQKDLEEFHAFTPEEKKAFVKEHIKKQMHGTELNFTITKVEKKGEKK